MVSSMKCPTRACSGAVHRIEPWNNEQFYSYVKAECNHCLMKYWLIKRRNKYQFRDRKEGESFHDHRKDKR